MQLLITLYIFLNCKPEKSPNFIDFCRFFNKLLITFYKYMFFIHSKNKIVHNFLLINEHFQAKNTDFQTVINKTQRHKTPFKTYYSILCMSQNKKHPRQKPRMQIQCSVIVCLSFCHRQPRRCPSTSACSRTTSKARCPRSRKAF